MAAAALATHQPHPPDDQEPEEREGAMSFLDHLEELRKRIIYSCIAAVVGMLVAFTFIDRIVAFVLSPAVHVLPPGSKLIYTEPAEAFLLELNVALIAGIILAAPFIFYQLWLFIAPGLYSKEKRFAIPFVVLTTLGALSGAAFTHYIVFPYMLAFFGTFVSTELSFMPKLSDTFDLYEKMLFGMSVVFQIPTIVLFLAKMQVVTARFLWRQTGYAILISFIAAAILTPSSDPFNQTMFAAPMIGLYLISIGIAWMVQPKGAAKNGHKR